MPPPVATEWGAMLLLWEVMISLRANRTSCYCYSNMWRLLADHRMTQTPMLLTWLCLCMTKFDASLKQGDQCKMPSRRDHVVIVRHRAPLPISFLHSQYYKVLDDCQWSCVSLSEPCRWRRIWRDWRIRKHLRSFSSFSVAYIVPCTGYDTWYKYVKIQIC